MADERACKERHLFACLSAVLSSGPGGASELAVHALRKGFADLDDGKALESESVAQSIKKVLDLVTDPHMLDVEAVKGFFLSAGLSTSEAQRCAKLSVVNKIPSPKKLSLLLFRDGPSALSIFSLSEEDDILVRHALEQIYPMLVTPVSGHRRLSMLRRRSSAGMEQLYSEELSQGGFADEGPEHLPMQAEEILHRLKEVADSMTLTQLCATLRQLLGLADSTLSEIVKAACRSLGVRATGTLKEDATLCFFAAMEPAGGWNALTPTQPQPQPQPQTQFSGTVVALPMHHLSGAPVMVALPAAAPAHPRPVAALGSPLRERQPTVSAPTPGSLARMGFSRASLPGSSAGTGSISGLADGSEGGIGGVMGSPPTPVFFRDATSDKGAPHHAGTPPVLPTTVLPALSLAMISAGEARERGRSGAGGGGAGGSGSGPGSESESASSSPVTRATTEVTSPVAAVAISVPAASPAADAAADAAAATTVVASRKSKAATTSAVPAGSTTPTEEASAAAPSDKPLRKDADKGKETEQSKEVVAAAAEGEGEPVRTKGTKGTKGLSSLQAALASEPLVVPLVAVPAPLPAQSGSDVQVRSEIKGSGTGSKESGDNSKGKGKDNGKDKGKVDSALGPALVLAPVPEPGAAEGGSSPPTGRQLTKPVEGDAVLPDIQGSPSPSLLPAALQPSPLSPIFPLPATSAAFGAGSGAGTPGTPAPLALAALGLSCVEGLGLDDTLPLRLSPAPAPAPAPAPSPSLSVAEAGPHVADLPQALPASSPIAAVGASGAAVSTPAALGPSLPLPTPPSALTKTPSDPADNATPGAAVGPSPTARPDQRPLRSRSKSPAATATATAGTPSSSSQSTSQSVSLEQFPQLLVAFYRKHNPSREKDVPAILKAFTGRESELVRKLEQQYKVPFLATSGKGGR